MNAGEGKAPGCGDLSHADWVVRASRFTQFVGLEIIALERGFCRSVLSSRAELLNQGGVIHGGLYAVVADHTAGVAASTVVAEGERVLTAEYKLNLLRPGDCERLLTEGRVIKTGRRLIIGEAEVFGEKAGEKKLLAKALLTFAVVANPFAKPSGGESEK